MKKWNNKDIVKEAVEVYKKISLKGANAKLSYKHRNACITYCSLKQYAEPRLYDYWENVKTYIRKMY